MFAINTKVRSKYFLILFLAVSYLAFLLIKPFVSSLLTGALIAYVFYPLYKKVEKKTENKNFSALLVSVILVVMIAVPLFFLINAISRETYIFYLQTKQKFASNKIFDAECTEGKLCELTNVISELLTNPKVRFYFEDTLAKIAAFIAKQASSFLLSIPTILINFFVALFSIFYLFRDGEAFVNKLKTYLPMKKRYQEEIFKSFNETAKAVIYSQIVIALVQGSLGALGFFLFGISVPILWGVVMVFSAFIPVVGTALIWVPAALSLVLNGIFGESVLIWKGVGLLLYGMLVISSVDNIIRPIAVGERSKLHPLLVLLGAIGGLKLFGFIGFIMGPLILALLVSFLRIYESEKDEIIC